MPRVLIVHRSTVPQGERARYLEKLRQWKQHYTANGCRFWAFEDAAMLGAFLEFAEAGDAETLEAADRTRSERIQDGSRIYREVELG